MVRWFRCSSPRRTRGKDRLVCFFVSQQSSEVFKLKTKCEPLQDILRVRNNIYIYCNHRDPQLSFRCVSFTQFPPISTGCSGTAVLSGAGDDPLAIVYQCFHLTTISSIGTFHLLGLLSLHISSQTYYSCL